MTYNLCAPKEKDCDCLRGAKDTNIESEDLNSSLQNSITFRYRSQ